MQIQRYSGAQFNPYGESDTVEPVDEWIAPTPTSPIAARLRLPGSKSLTNRELVLAALADAPGRLLHPLRSRDSELMIGALRALGVGVDESGPAGSEDSELLITPAELLGGASIDCGLAGTVMRFVPPLAALALGSVSIDGDERARQRPMRELVTTLRALGADVADDGRGLLPFTVHGTGTLRGGSVSIDASASSQFVSALLLAAPRFEEGLELRHRGDRLPSLPHIEMTVEVLAQRGVTVETPEPGLWRVAPGPIVARDVAIEPDLSNAAPFLIAAIVAGGRVSVEGWPETTTQVGDSLRDILPRFGATVTLDDGLLTVDGGAGIRGGLSVPGVDLDLSEGGELAPALVALAALADSPSRVVGIGHLRGHETDRLHALRTEIVALGGAVTELDDGLEIVPGPLHPGLWHSYADHRMATAGAVIGLAVPELRIDDIATTAKTMPEFPELWRETIGGGTSFTTLSFG